MATPFTYAFSSDERRYLYDVNSNCIMEVDESLYSLVDRVDWDARGQLVRAAGPATAPPDDGAGSQPEADNALGRTLAEIQKYHQERHLFSGHKPAAIRFPFSKRELALILDHLLGHVILNVTESCNLRCSYCKFSGRYLYARTHSNRQMDTSVALAALRFMLERCDYLIERTSESLGIGFYGGEPLLNIRLIQRCVDYVREHYAHLLDRINFSITTNLTANDEAIDYLVDNRFFVLVSLDGPQPLHDRYRRSAKGRGTFESIMANLRRMKDRDEQYYRTHVGFSVVLAPPYDLQTVVDFFSRDELTTERRLVLSFVDDDDTTFFTDCCGTEAANPTEQMQALRASFETHLMNGTFDGRTHVLNALFGDKLRDVHTRPAVMLQDHIYPNGICIPGYHRFLVNPEGRFYMCEKIGYDLPIGDIERGFDVDAIYRAIEDYIAISEPQCLSCWALRLCKMCFTRTLRGGQLDVSRKEQNCRLVKQGVLRALKMFTRVYDANPAVLDRLYGDSDKKGGMEIPFRFIREQRAAAVRQ